MLRRSIYALLHIYWRLWRPVVLGSRALVIRDGKILLVRLSYAKGWCLPGGGVDRGESFHEGMIRELREECAIEAKSLSLFGLYHTTRQGKIDHVAIFVVTDFSEIRGAASDPEIEEMRYFSLGELPEDTTPATRRRVREYLDQVKDVSAW